MTVNFWKINPPTMETALAFGSTHEPFPLPGGFGNSYISGDIVLRPCESKEVSEWVAEVFDQLPDVRGVRFSRPVRSKNGSWMEGNYIAMRFLPGEHARGRYDEKLKASFLLHRVLRDIPKPKFMDRPRHSWAVSHQVAFEEEKFDYGPEFAELYEEIKPYLKDIDLPYQIVHADLPNNFLFEKGLDPAIIDFSPTWAPVGFAEGIMLADVVTWEDATLEEAGVFKAVPSIEKLAWRGLLARVVEQAEHVKWFGKDKDLAVETARKYKKAIEFFKKFFANE